MPQEERVEVLYNADDVRVRRFGGEGQAQSFFDYQWQIGRPCRLFVEAVVNDGKTVYTAWFYLSESQSWKRLATFRTAASGDRLRGLYSFIEDFRRDGASALEMRRATFASGWVRDAAGKWSPLSRARFSASGAEWEAKKTIDAGFAGEQLYLQTGGQTQTSNPLGATLTRPAGTRSAAGRTRRRRRRTVIFRARRQGGMSCRKSPFPTIMPRCRTVFRPCSGAGRTRQGGAGSRPLDDKTAHLVQLAAAAAVQSEGSCTATRNGASRRALSRRSAAHGSAAGEHDWLPARGRNRELGGRRARRDWPR